MNKAQEYISNFGYATKLIYHASKKYFLLKLVFSLATSFLPFFPLLLWRELINELVFFFDNKNGTELIHRIWMLAGVYCIVIFLQRLVDTLSEYITYRYNDAINYYLDNVMIDKVSSIDLAFFDSSDLNDKLNNSWSLIHSTKQMVGFVFNMLQVLIRLVVSFLLLFFLSPWLVLVVIVFCFPTIIGDKKSHDIDYLFHKEHAKTHRKLNYYKNLFFDRTHYEVVLYNLKDYFSHLYKKTWVTWDKAVQKKNSRVCLIRIVSLILLATTEIVVYFLSVVKLIAGEIAVGDVAYYVSLLTQFRGDFTSLCRHLTLFEKNSKELNDVRSFIEMEPLIEKSGQLIPSSMPKIEFKDVSFKYPNSEKNVLTHCSFLINPGETIGLVGLNGSGKSTIVKLLCRFYDPTDGHILIDGVDIKAYDIVKYRELFGIMFQDYVRYSFTLRENIALSNMSQIDDSKRIEDACMESGVCDFLVNWEKGIDEMLTRRFDKNGKELSGGQWQRVSLARAFFRNAPVIILDEPSAALDPIAEHQIFEKFSKISKNKSALLISHRLSSITLTDRIIVLEEGRIIESGSHKELIDKKGRYAQLFFLQASKYQET